MTTNERIIDMALSNKKELSSFFGVTLFVAWIVAMSTGTQWLRGTSGSDELLSMFRSIFLIGIGLAMSLEISWSFLSKTISTNIRIAQTSSLLTLLGTLGLTIGLSYVKNNEWIVAAAVLIIAISVTPIIWIILERYSDRSLRDIMYEMCVEICLGILICCSISTVVDVIGDIFLSILPLASVIFLTIGFEPHRLFEGGELEAEVTETHISPVRLIISVMMAFFVVNFHKSTFYTMKDMDTSIELMSSAWIMLTIALFSFLLALIMRKELKINLDRIYSVFSVAFIGIALLFFYDLENPLLSVLFSFWPLDFYIVLFGIAILYITWQQNASSRRKIMRFCMVTFLVMGVITYPTVINGIVFSLIENNAVFGLSQTLPLLLTLLAFLNFILSVTGKVTYSDLELTAIMDNSDHTPPEREQHVNECGIKYDLSAREKEVLLLLLEGNSADQVAEKLFISKYTVRAHTRNMYEKMGVHSRKELKNCVESH